MATGEPQITFPKELRLQKLHLKLSKPTSSDTDVKITLKGNNGRTVETKKRFKVEKGTALERIECAIGGKPWTEDIENFRIDDSTSIHLQLTKAGSGFMTRNKRESAVVRWSHIKSANRTGDELVYETEDLSLKATVRLQFQASPAEVRLDSIEVGVQKAILSQDDREEITSKFKSINNTLKPILEALEKVSQIHPVAIVVVGLVKMAHDRLLDRQIKYDEVVQNLLQDMTNIHPFARVASMNQCNDIGLVHQTIVEMLNLMQDACEVITASNHNGQRAHLKVLTAVSGEDLVQEFKRKLDNVISNFNMALNTEAHAKIMTVDQRAEAIEIKEWLTSLDVIKRFDSLISTHVPGTGSWFLEREDIRTWIEGESDAVRLFCTGIPGCGKTMMISLVCKAVLQKNRKSCDTAILSVYFDHKDPQTHSFENILLSFTRQLLEQSDTTPEWIRNYYHDHKTFKDIDILRTQLSAKLKSSYSTVFILADAMDECPPNVQRKFLDFLKLLSVNTHVLITSRPGQGLPEDLSLWTIVNLKADSDDLLKYIEHRLSDSYDPDMLKNQEDLCTDIKAKVLSHADGVMLLAKLHMDAIIEQNTVADLIDVLDNLPMGLAATFENTAQRIKAQRPNDAKLALKVLMWIVGAERPLSVRELQCAAALKLSEPCFDERAQPASATMTRVCAGLVVVDDERDVVRLVHLTVQEYFNGVKEVFFGDMQVQLATLCLNYLLSISRQGLIYGGSERPWYEEGVPAFLQYCSSEWPHHCSGCQLRVLNLVLDVLQNDVAIEHSFNAINRYIWRRDLDGTGLHLVAYHGLREIMTVILQNGTSTGNLTQATAMAATKLAETVQNRNSKGRTPLSYAAGHGHLNVVEALLAKDEVAVDDSDKSGRTPLSYAAKYGHLDVMKALLVKGNVAVDDKDESGRTPLSYAAQYGHLDVVTSLLVNDEVAVDDKDKSGRTPLSYAADYGHLNVMKALLVKGNVAVDDKDESGRTPLSYAAQYGHLDVVTSLLVNDEVAVDDKDESGRTPLSYAAQDGTPEIISALLEQRKVQSPSKDLNDGKPVSQSAVTGHIAQITLMGRRGVQPDSKDGKGRTPLSYAAERGHLEAIKLLLAREEVKADVKDESGKTALLYAADSPRENLEVISALLAQSWIKADERDSLGRTPLSHAAENGRLKVVSALLAREDVDADGVDDEGDSPLIHATKSYRRPSKTVSSLIAHGAQVNRKDKEGRTPLSYSAEWGDTEAVNLLLAQDGIKPDEGDDTGRTPLSYAAQYGHTGCLKALLARDEVVADSKDNEGRTPLSHGAQNGDIDVINDLLMQDKVDADSRDNNGRAPLSYAAEYGNLDAVEELLERDGVDQNCIDVWRKTPLTYAAEYGHLNVVTTLLALDKVKCDAKDKSGKTPLIYAAEYGHLDVVKTLMVRHGVDVDTKDNRGRTALVYAALRGHVPVVNALIDQGKVDLTVRDKKGSTLLAYAASCGGKTGDVVNIFLLTWDADADVEDLTGEAPISYAASNGNLEAVKALIAREDVQVDRKDIKGITPLWRAAGRGHRDVVVMLLRHGKVEVNNKDNKGITALSNAARLGHVEVIEVLLAEDDVELNSQDNDGRTPLSYAAGEGRKEVVRRLLQIEAIAVHLANKSGSPPILFAELNGHSEIVEMLQEHGAVPELADALGALFNCELLCTQCLKLHESLTDLSQK